MCLCAFGWLLCTVLEILDYRYHLRLVLFSLCSKFNAYYASVEPSNFFFLHRLTLSFSHVNAHHLVNCVNGYVSECLSVYQIGHLKDVRNFLTFRFDGNQKGFLSYGFLFRYFSHLFEASLGAFLALLYCNTIAALLISFSISVARK